ncbi:MAG: hypothetical protein AAB562_03020, partial [Patescibacteria group bacterium]
IIGHQKIVRFLEQSLSEGKLAHAYLFVGPPHAGKTKVAARFAAALLGRTESQRVGPEDDFAAVRTHPDFFLLEREVDDETGKMKRDIGIGAISSEGREARADGPGLLERVSQSAFLGGRKVAVVLEADHLNASSANAMLKLLEEPPRETIFILVAAQEQRLPTTVVSRTVLLRFGLVPEAEIRKALLARGLSSDDTAFALSYANGRPGVALALAGDGEARDALRERSARFHALFSSTVPERFAVARDLLGKNKSGYDGKEQMKEELALWLSLLRRALLARYLPGDAAAPFDSLARISTSKLLALADRTAQAKRDLDMNINPALAVENLLLAFEA